MYCWLAWREKDFLMMFSYSCKTKSAGFFFWITTTICLNLLVLFRHHIQEQWFKNLMCTSLFSYIKRANCQNGLDRTTIHCGFYGSHLLQWHHTTTYRIFCTAHQSLVCHVIIKLRDKSRWWLELIGSIFIWCSFCLLKTDEPPDTYSFRN